MAKPLELFLHGHFLEGLHDIGFPDIVVVLDLQTTVVAFGHFLHVVLEPFERRQFPGIDHHPVAYQADLGVPENLSAGYHTAGNGTELGDFEGLSDLRGTGYLFLDFRGEHALHGVLEVVDGIVDDRVHTDIDLFLVGQGSGIVHRPYVETDDHGIGGTGQQYIGFGDGPNPLMDDVDLDLIGGQLLEGIRQGLDRTVHVPFEDDVQLLEVAQGDPSSDFVQGDVTLGPNILFPLQLGAFGSDLLGLPFIQ